MERLQELLKEYDCLRETADDAELENWLKRACAAYDVECGEDLVGRASLYNELGSFYRGTGLYAKGEAAYRNAKALLEQAGEATVLDYATTVNNLAGLYRLDKRFDQALEHFREAMRIYTGVPGTPPQIFASVYNNLALVYIDMQQYDAALSELDTAMSMLGDGTDALYELATTCGNMAVVFVGLGRLREAHTYMQRAVEIYASMLGEAHPTYQGSVRFLQMLERALSQNGETK